MSLLVGDCRSATATCLTYVECVSIVWSIFTHTHTHTHPHIHAYVQTHVLIYTYTRTKTAHTHTHAFAHAHLYAPLCALIYTHTRRWNYQKRLCLAFSYQNSRLYSTSRSSFATARYVCIYTCISILYIYVYKLQTVLSTPQLIRHR